MGKDSQGKKSECFVKVNCFDCERDDCTVLLPPSLQIYIIIRLCLIFYLFIPTEYPLYKNMQYNMNKYKMA